ncbi:23S rRNA methyltransferase [[Clostridium] symbiosum]|nr:23S rRNA methyltransferase [[Clostridium] symbiosum]
MEVNPFSSKIICGECNITFTPRPFLRLLEIRITHSTHVETVVLLSKLKSAKSIEVKIELDEMDLTIAESKATYDKIKQYVLDKTGLKVSQLYIAQVKRKHGLIERINYNVGDGKAKVPQVPLEKEEAIEDALRHFKMI